MPHSPGIGAIFGIVSENGVAKAGGRVGLYDRSNMLLVSKTVADSLGGYVFTGLNQTTNDYLVMALDDDGTPAKNALVQDYIQPIPGHMGAVAYSNWPQRARRKDAYVLWAPRFEGIYPETMGAGIYSQTLGATGGSYVLQSSLTPGAPQYPSIRLNTGWVGVPPFHMGTYWPSTGTDAASLEFVVDTTVDFQVTSRGYGSSFGNAREICHVGVSWVAATKLVRFASANGNFTGSYDLTSTTFFNTNTYTATGLPNGVHHFALVVVAGATQKLYIDGVLVSTKSISGTNALFQNNGHLAVAVDWGILLSGINPSLTATFGNATFGPVAAYHTALSDADVAASYNDLMIGTIPASSGYVREILTDDPGLLYRLDDSAYGNAIEFLTLLPSAKHFGAITFTNPSPVVGGSMTYFGGGLAKATRGSGGGSPSQRTYEFWVKPDSITPPNNGNLFCAHYSVDGEQFWYKVQQVQTSGVLRLTVLTGKTSPGYSNEVHTFLYAPPVSVVTYIAIVLDKIAGNCKLYVDGVFQEQVSATGSFFSEGEDQTNPNGYIDTLFYIGGWVNSLSVFSEPFKGYLSEVAVYYKALPADRIKAHYDARLLI